MSWIDRLQRLFKQLTNYSKSFILKQLGISRSSYYYQKNKIDNDTELVGLIKQIQSNNPFYGYRRITLALKQKNIIVNHKRILRIMQKYQLKNTQFRLSDHNP